MSKKKKQIIFMIGVLSILIVLIAGGFFFKNVFLKKTIANCILSEWNEVKMEDTPGFLQKIDEISSYEIISVDKEATYTIHVVVKGIDLGSKLRELTYEDFPKEEKSLNHFLMDMIVDCEMVETSTEIYAKKTKSGYKITFSDTFVDAMTGKIYSYYMEQINNALEE